MPESFIENNVEFERWWHRFEQCIWTLLALVLVAAGAGLFGSGPLAERVTRSGDGTLRVSWDRIARARASSPLRFEVGARQGEARITLRGGLAARGALRDITPVPKESVAGRDAITMVWAVEPGSAATVRMQQVLDKPGILRSRIESADSAVDLEQVVLP